MEVGGQRSYKGLHQHGGLLTVPRLDSQMQASISSSRSYVGPVPHPPCATMDGHLSSLSSYSHGLASILIEVLGCRMQALSLP